MCFTTNGDLAGNQIQIYRKVETILRNQMHIYEQVESLKNNQKLINSKLDSILQHLTHREDKGEN